MLRDQTAPRPADGADRHSKSVARENLLFPLATRLGRLLLAMARPDDTDTLAKLQFIFNCDIEAFPASADQIRDAIERHSRRLPPAEAAEDLFEFVDVAFDPPAADSRPVVALVNILLGEAAGLRATEIRIEPQADRILVLYRIDGKMVERDGLPRRLLGVVAERLRAMAGLGLHRDQSGQPGRIQLSVKGIVRDFDLVITPIDLGPQIILM